MKEELKEWQFFYNWQRPHGSLSGKTPSQYSSELGNETPFWDEVIAAYDPKKEHFQEQSYYVEMAIRKLKPCL
ncbi:transposase [Candidatus Paracaedimonas acanthamoebae]|nr:transposase [Candidatus Paracaedimonas acanthamoebae]